MTQARQKISFYHQAKTPRASRRHSLTDLMALYEQNYLLLRCLAPKLREFPIGSYISHAPNAMDLYLGIQEQTRFTSTLHLTYRFAEQKSFRSQPDLTIRVYYDARVAEVVSGLIHGKRFETRRQRDLENSWQLNRFLYKWLGYCRRQHHSFKQSIYAPN